MVKDATAEEINAAIQKAREAFFTYQKLSLQARAVFMREIARQLELLGDKLLEVAGSETHLSRERLITERARTIFQLQSYADACERGDWMDIRIDTAVPGNTPSKTDIRKMMIPLGPVAVFGAANFPFAYSTAGGDTAAAFAAGCAVVVKAHPAHVATSTMVATAIHKSVDRCGLPAAVFTHLQGASFEVGRTIVEHPFIKAVGFTGSYAGGKQLFDWANQRKEPIPVFAEMSSINPVFLLPEKLREDANTIAEQYAASITLGRGQFCTNPGLLIGIAGPALDTFSQLLAQHVQKALPGTMLNPGIYKNYVEKRGNALSQENVLLLAVSSADSQLNEGAPTLATTTAETFLNNSILHQEVFGPYSLLIQCKDKVAMMEVAKQLEGQLTATVMATKEDILQNEELIGWVKNKCGRFILNGVPTGVEVCLSMQHGGPFPATTDSRFTAVGADGIKRFARPLAYQNWPDDLLPDELKHSNPLGIWRTVNNIPGKH